MKKRNRSAIRPANTKFVMKDSPDQVKESAGPDVEPKGRTYDCKHAGEPGGIRCEELVLGMKLASIAITDDNENTLKKVGKTNPWQIEALKIVTGSKEEAHKPLSTILSTHFDLKCDTIIDVSGFTAAGHFLDTQGYIAHNDEMIVLAYRCTTSAFDWLTNFSTTSSAWEPDIDMPQGHSGYLSCVEGCCGGESAKPRVHTGFYNNFLVTGPIIQKYIDPLLAPDQPPRKLFVVGHSLGAGVATMAACYFLLNHDWENLPHRLVHLTAGSPRACLGSMKRRIQTVMEKVRPLDKAVICRVVRDRDIVAKLPPSIFGFQHLDKLVYITDDEELLINPKLKGTHTVEEGEMKKILGEQSMSLIDIDTDSDSDDEGEKEGDNSDFPEGEDSENPESKPRSKYESKIAIVPQPLRDHMPEFYLKPLIGMFEMEEAASVPVLETSVPDIVVNVPDIECTSHVEDTPSGRTMMKRAFDEKKRWNKRGIFRRRNQTDEVTRNAAHC